MKYILSAYTINEKDVEDIEFETLSEAIRYARHNVWCETNDHVNMPLTCQTNELTHEPEFFSAKYNDRLVQICTRDRFDSYFAKLILAGNSILPKIKINKGN